MGLFGNRPERNVDMENRLSAVETGLKLVRLEVEESLEKVTAALARLRKRDRDAAGPVAPPEETPADKRAALWARASEVLRRTK